MTDVASDSIGRSGAGHPGGLSRVLGGAFGLAIAIGATIGGGILGTPGQVAALLPATGLFLLAWVAGAVQAFTGATAYAELGAMMPRSGGMYVYAARAFGRRVGFFTGYADWINWSTAPAALLLLASDYLGVLFPPLGGHAVLVSFAILAGFILLQWAGVRWGGRAQEITSLLKTVALLGLIVAALVLPHPPAGPSAERAVPHGLALLMAFAVAMQGVVFTYDSYYTVIYCGEEIRDPAREIPRSMFRGLWLIIAIYLLANLSFVAVLPVGSMAGDSFVGGSVARAVFGPRGDAIIRAVMVISILGTVNAELMAAPRILHAMARDGLFPRAGMRVNAGGTPAVGLLLTGAVVAAGLLLGSFDAVVAVTAIIIAALYVVSFAALFALRRREPGLERPYRAWGYPWAPGFALVSAAALLIGMAAGTPWAAGVVAGLLLVSWPVERLIRRRGAAGR